MPSAVRSASREKELPILGTMWAENRSAQREGEGGVQGLHRALGEVDRREVGLLASSLFPLPPPPTL